MANPRDRGAGGVLNLIPTDEISIVNGVPCRLWEGVTGGEIRVAAFVATLILDPADLDGFRREFGPNVFALARQARPGELRPGGGV